MKDTLKTILSITSTSENNILLSHYILNETRKTDCLTLVDPIGNILIQKGKSKVYPCVTAHLDTVQPYGPKKIEEKDGVLTCNTGIGGDDKCGIFICLELLKMLPVIKVAFFVGEEVGCEGSRKVDLDWFKDVGYIIGIDRRGNSDYINEHSMTQTTSDRFEVRIAKIKKEYNYKSTSGLITDVFALMDRKINISVCNVSCGYYDPHTLKESVVVKDVINSLGFVRDLIKKMGCEMYGCIKPKIKHTTSANTYACFSCNKWATCNPRDACSGWEKKQVKEKPYCATCLKWFTCNHNRSTCSGWIKFTNKNLIKKANKLSVCSGCHEPVRGACCINCKSPHNKSNLVATTNTTTDIILPKNEIIVPDTVGMKKCIRCFGWKNKEAFLEGDVCKECNRG